MVHFFYVHPSIIDLVIPNKLFLQQTSLDHYTADKGLIFKGGVIATRSASIEKRRRVTNAVIGGYFRWEDPTSRESHTSTPFPPLIVVSSVSRVLLGKVGYLLPQWKENWLPTPFLNMSCSSMCVRPRHDIYFPLFVCLFLFRNRASFLVAWGREGRWTYDFYSSCNSSFSGGFSSFSFYSLSSAADSPDCMSSRNQAPMEWKKVQRIFGT